MLKTIESNLYKVSIDDNYKEKVFRIEIKETESYITIFQEESEELIHILNKANEIL